MLIRLCMVGYAEYPSDVRIRREVDALLQDGHQVDVICLQEIGRPHRERIDDVEVYRVRAYKFRGSGFFPYAWSYIRFFFAAAVILTRLHVKKRYNIIQFHTLPDFVVFAGLVPRLMGARLVLDMHEVMPEFYMTKFKVDQGHLIVKILRWIERISVQFADAVIVVTDPIERLIRARCRPRGPLVVIMNTTDEKRFRLAVDNTSPRKPDQFVVMYHGTLTPLYGLDVAIKAMRLLKGRIPGLQLRIFGNEAEADYLKQLAQKEAVTDVVRFMGRVPHSQIVSWIGQADVGVLPILRDIFVDLSFSNKLAEYVVSRVPVVATRLRSTLEYFPDGSVSYFESGDPSDLARRILELYLDPDSRRKKAELAWKYYQAIRWEFMEERYRQLLSKLCTSSGF